VVCATTEHVNAAFNASGRSYDSRRLVSTLQGQSIKIGRHKVTRLMREVNLKPVWKKKFVCTTDSNHDLPVANNILNLQPAYYCTRIAVANTRAMNTRRCSNDTALSAA
jgi:putative transposase